MSRPLSEKVLLNGPAGRIEALIDTPSTLRGIALVAHPHPLYGGANTNKVAHTLARALQDLGYAVVRPNFRGVGESEGAHDHGEGETEDLLSVLAWAQSRWGFLPVALGGFSFGAYVQIRVAAHLSTSLAPVERLVLVGMATGLASDGERHYRTPPLPEGLSSVVIHGEKDETVPLQNVLDWARPQSLPVLVIPGADHFFHGRLSLIREWIVRAFLGDARASSL
jgi:uncharacterized protein